MYIREDVKTCRFIDYIYIFYVTLICIKRFTDLCWLGLTEQREKIRLSLEVFAHRGQYQTDT